VSSLRLRRFLLVPSYRSRSSFRAPAATSSEPDNAPGGADRNTDDDDDDVDQDTFRLRAERNENGAGRTYTITYRAVDACGNATTESASVTVPIGQ